MSWQKWVLIAVQAINALATVYMIGKPRKAIDHETALIVVVVNVALCALVVTA